MTKMKEWQEALRAKDEALRGLLFQARLQYQKDAPELVQAEAALAIAVEDESICADCQQKATVTPLTPGEQAQLDDAWKKMVAFEPKGDDPENTPPASAGYHKPPMCGGRCTFQKGHAGDCSCNIEPVSAEPVADQLADYKSQRSPEDWAAIGEPAESAEPLDRDEILKSFAAKISESVTLEESLGKPAESASGDTCVHSHREPGCYSCLDGAIKRVEEQLRLGGMDSIYDIPRQKRELAEARAKLHEQRLVSQSIAKELDEARAELERVRTCAETIKNLVSLVKEKQALDRAAEAGRE